MLDVCTLVKSLNMRKIIVLHLTNGPSSGLNVLGNETNVGRGDKSDYSA